MLAVKTFFAYLLKVLKKTSIKLTSMMKAYLELVLKVKNIMISRFIRVLLKHMVMVGVPKEFSNIWKR